MGRKYQGRVYAGGEVYSCASVAARWEELKKKRDAGEIQKLDRFVDFELIPRQEGERACKYIADFVYWENGEIVVEDVSSCNNAAQSIKRKLMLWRFGIRVRELNR